jgi:soluble lytic murein transglycosylase
MIVGANAGSFAMMVRTTRGTGSWLAAGILVAVLLAEAGAGAAPGRGPQGILDAAARDAAGGNLAGAIETLRTLDGRTIPPALRQQADLLLGILLIREGQREVAIPPLERAATTYPLLADYALYYLAVAHRQGDRASAAAQFFHRLVDQYPESLLAERAGRELPRLWLDAGDLPKAEAAAGRYLGGRPQAPGRAAVWLTLAEVLLRSGRTSQAEEVLRRIWVELPASGESHQVNDLLATIPAARPFTPEEQFERARTLYHLGRYGQAKAELAPFAADPAREIQARLFLGISAFNLRQYTEALQWLGPLRQRAVGGGQDHWDALYWLGRGYARSGDLTQFRETMTLLADTAPQTRRAEEALYLLALTAADGGEPAEANSYLARLLQEFPRGLWTDRALWLQGWLAYKAREPQLALAAWRRLLRDEPGSALRTPALYWQGRALEAAKRLDEAAQAYQTLLQTAPDEHYYRVRAGDRLSRLRRKGALTTARTPAPAAGKPAAAADTVRVRKARALQGLGLNDEAVEEYSDQVRAHPENRAGLAEACRAFVELQRYEKAVHLAGRVLRSLFIQENGQPPIPQFWECVYPLGHWPLVRDEAVLQGLDPYLVTALIREESGFAPRAVSRAGARGLMQLMLPTAEQVARAHKEAVPTSPALDAPEVNVRLGTFHLADLIRDYGGNLSLAIASYNAGSHHVRRWRDRWGYTDDEEFVEDIPFPETRGYVKRVLGSYERYSSLYGQKRAESREPRGASRRARGNR